MARKPALASLSIDEIHLELRTRQRALASLEHRRQRLLKQLEGIDAEIANLGGSVNGRGSSGGSGRTRPRNESNLLEALQATLKGKTMSVTDAAEAVQRAGYQTTSPNFKTIVNQTLLKRKHFKRVGRGQYTAA